MTSISRRKFLATAALSAAAVRLHAQTGGTPLTLEVPAEATGPHVPLDFVGLSYEVQQLADPTFFSPSNEGLIRQCKALSPHGVLRLGGNTSEFAWWKATPASPEPEHPPTREVEGEPRPQYYAVTAEAVRQLRKECGDRQIGGAEGALHAQTHDFFKGTATVLAMQDRA